MLFSGAFLSLGMRALERRWPIILGRSINAATGRSVPNILYLKDGTVMYRGKFDISNSK